jgi:hypothetical protein
VIDREHERLLHEYVGGTASERDSARIEAWLQTSREGRDRRRELEALFQVLASVPHEMPPAALHDGVLEAIRLRRDAQGRPARAPMRPRWLLLAPAAAVAALLAISAPMWWRGLRPGGGTDVSGTLVGRPVSDHTMLNLPGAGISSRASWESDRLMFDFFVSAPGPSQLVLGAPDARFAHARVMGIDPGRLEVKDDGRSAVIRLETRAHFQLLLDARTAPREPGHMIFTTGGQRTEGALPVPRPNH